jgi:copper chaperone CopZ
MKCFASASHSDLASVRDPYEPGLRLSLFHRILRPADQSIGFTSQRRRYHMRQVVLAFLVVALSAGVVLAQSTQSETVKLSVTGMHCDNCVQKVDKALRGVEGVKDVKVDLKEKTAEVALAATSVKTETLVKAVSDVGFKAQLASAASSSTKEEKCACCSGKDGHKQKAGTGKDEDCCKNMKKADKKS